MHVVMEYVYGWGWQRFWSTYTRVCELTLIYFSDSSISDDDYSPPEQLKVVDPTKSPIKYAL